MSSSATKVVLNQALLGEMHSHASQTYPEECCGLMLGCFEENSVVKRVNSLKRMKNVFEAKERYHRYTIDPKQFMLAETEAENRGEEIVGIYHSHPNAPAKPSKFDQDHAWPTLSYVVIEVRDANPIRTASWLLKEDRSDFLQEELQVVTVTKGSSGGNKAGSS